MLTTTPFSIIIADDDDGDRKQIRRALVKANLPCRITEAANMHDVMIACEHEEHDCIILDHQMPGETGLEGINTLHQKWPYMAIIMATGQGDELIASEAFKYGASDYIPKHIITESSIARIIEHALQKANFQIKINEQREALESFANTLTHDLRAPIRHIRTFSNLMVEAIKAGNYPEVLHFYERIDSAGERMDELIDTLSEYNKLSRNEVNFSTTSLESILESALDNLTLSIEESGAIITHDELPTVYGNSPQLIQLLQNIISNGIKYCQSTPPTIHISAKETDEKWRICLKDNGIGIQHKFHKDIFTPFRRVHDSNEYAGSGLGLATCKRIIARHNGTIWCESDDGNGTSFFFTIPKENYHEYPDIKATSC